MQTRFGRGLLILGSVLILGLAFGAGFFAGRMSARPDVGAGFSRVILGGHGAIGRIQSIEGQTITLEVNAGATQIVLVNAETVYERGPRRRPIALSDLKVGDRVAVIGAPNADGHIVAKTINQFVTLATPTPSGSK